MLTRWLTLTTEAFETAERIVMQKKRGQRRLASTFCILLSARLWLTRIQVYGKSAEKTMESSQLFACVLSHTLTSADDSADTDALNSRQSIAVGSRHIHVDTCAPLLSSACRICRAKHEGESSFLVPTHRFSRDSAYRGTSWMSRLKQPLDC